MAKNGYNAKAIAHAKYSNWVKIGHAYNYGQSVESLSNLTSLPGDEQNSFSKVIVNSPPTKMVPLVQTCPLPLLTCLTNEYNGISADNTLQLEPVFERKGNNNNKNNAM